MLETLKKNIIKHEDQGYALYFYNNGQTFEEVHGKVAGKASDDITFDSNFRLASVTKQFIAFCIVTLVQKGMLEYDQNIKDIFDELPNYFYNITVKHLLNHTSGIYNYEDMPHEEDGNQLVDSDIIAFLQTTAGTYFEPGTVYKYSNTGYILLGLIVEKVSGKTISEFVNEEIFIKAEMENSKVNIEGQTKIKHRAYGHILEKSKLVLKDQYWCSATIGDGGIYSSINDLKKWCQFLYSSKQFKDMKIPNYINKEEYNEYGLGIRIINVNGKDIYYHCGSTIGTNTLLLFSKDYNMCLIFLTNLNGIDTGIMRDNLIEYLKTKTL